MEFHIAQAKDQAAIEWLWDYCFEKRDDAFFQWFFTRYYRMENVLGGYEEDTLVSCLHLIPYELYLRGRELSASYIVGVATYPEARRGGTIRQLLQAALEEMRRRGRYVTILMPSKAGFYYPYQWELCYHHYKYMVPLEDLRGISRARGAFRQVQSEADIEKIQRVYQDFVADKHGYAVRSEKRWQFLLEEQTIERGFTYLLEHEGQPEGYIIYLLRDNRVLVREMAYTSIAAQKALFQFLYNHRSQVEFLEWNAPLDDTTYMVLPEPKKEIRLFPFMTGRLVDVQAVLETICYPQGVTMKVAFDIQDELADWNNRTFTLEVAEGRGTVEVSRRCDGEIKCAIGSFSQLFFGRVSGRQLLKMGRLTAEYPASIEKLELLFPKCNNYINEYY
jgi:predicted acetyltransferase